MDACSSAVLEDVSEQSSAVLSIISPACSTMLRGSWILELIRVPPNLAFDTTETTFKTDIRGLVRAFSGLDFAKPP